MDCPAGMITTSAETSVDAVCVPLALVESVSRAVAPESASLPLSVMNGPGLFVQPLGVACSETRAVWENDWLMLAALAGGAIRAGGAGGRERTRRDPSH